MAEIIWQTSKKKIPYQEALQEMEEYVAKIHSEDAADKVWMLEHPKIYTIGTSGKETDILKKTFPIYKTGRGGEVTYHGPGMRIIYIMMSLKKRKKCDIKQYVCDLEQVIINSLKHYGLKGVRKTGHIGVWIKNGDKQDKITAIGVRVRKWISFHGLAFNINPDLKNFTNIIPCGISDPKYGVTSLKKLNKNISFDKFDEIFKKEFLKIFK